MKSIRVGTRNSPLAMWQANEVAGQLNALGYETVIFPVLASGDKNLTQPLYSMGITGVFTKDLDVALLNGEIDIAVHSLKDVPTQMPQNLQLVAYLERDFPQDVLIRNSKAIEKPLHELKVATSSLRRRAFWLKEFKTAEFTDIRGNVQTRLQKLENGLADATLFSLAGIKRLGLSIDFEELPFMIPAPSQGVVTVAARIDSPEITEVLAKINHRETQLCVETEREFLSALEGGCTAPIGAFAEIMSDKMRLRARLCSLNGENCIETDDIFSLNEVEGAGKRFAEQVLANGGKEIMDEIKNADIRA